MNRLRGSGHFTLWLFKEGPVNASIIGFEAPDGEAFTDLPDEPIRQG